MLGGFLSAFVQPLGQEPPEQSTVDSLIRLDVVLLAIELVLIALLVLGLVTSTASHAEAANLVLGGSYTVAFWGVIVVAGILVPIALQSLELVAPDPAHHPAGAARARRRLRAALGHGQCRAGQRDRAGGAAALEEASG